MKCLNLYCKIAVPVLILTLAGCGTSESGVAAESSDSTTVQIDNPSITLTDYISRLAGVQVHGSGPTASVQIRGVNSFNLTTSPLFVLDGVRVGRDLTQVYGLVNMHEVNSIRVLRGYEAAIYGVEGGNGVIVITTDSN